MSQKLKIGVVGAGVFGGYHANKCAEHPRTDFAGIFDPDRERAEVGAAKHGVKAYHSYADMLSDVEAVVIACPAKYHGDMAIEALQAGKHCLIEKPIAPTLGEAEQIVSLAKEKKLIVQIGHQERFVAKAIGLDRISETPICIRASRMNLPSERGLDVSVTLDLMTHDLDLVMMLVGEIPHLITSNIIYAEADHPDYVMAELSFSATKAHLKASRVENKPLRRMAIFYPSGR